MYWKLLWAQISTWGLPVPLLWVVLEYTCLSRFLLLILPFPSKPFLTSQLLSGGFPKAPALRCMPPDGFIHCTGKRVYLSLSPCLYSGCYLSVRHMIAQGYLKYCRFKTKHYLHPSFGMSTTDSFLPEWHAIHMINRAVLTHCSKLGTLNCVPELFTHNKLISKSHRFYQIIYLWSDLSSSSTLLLLTAYFILLFFL